MTSFGSSVTRRSDRGLLRLAELIRGYSGICIGPDKQLLVENRLRHRIRELGISGMDEYVVYVSSDRSGQELEKAVDLLTTNHTSFFREGDQLRAVFERLSSSLRGAMASPGPVRVWSAAASSGEEPYSLAMLAAEERRMSPHHEWVITASDISRRMLHLAERGVYMLSATESVPRPLLHRYFEKGVGPQEGRCRVLRSLRETVSFRRINLVQNPYPLEALQHVIVCRNLLIYFDKSTQQSVVSSLTDSLDVGGYLIVGYSETLNGPLGGLRSIGQGIYRRL